MSKAGGGSVAGWVWAAGWVWGGLGLLARQLKMRGARREYMPRHPAFRLFREGRARERQEGGQMRDIYILYMANKENNG